MNVHRYLGGLLIIGMAIGLVQPLARAEDGTAVEAPAFGSLRGVTLDPGGQPLAMVSVAIHSMDGSTDRKIVSARDGVFVADHLTPGQYLITAAKEGLASPSAARVEVERNQTASHNLILAAAKPATAAAPAPPRTIESELEAMKERIAALEAELRARPAPEPATPRRRQFPQEPLNRPRRKLRPHRHSRQFRPHPQFQKLFRPMLRARQWTTILRLPLATSLG